MKYIEYFEHIEDEVSRICKEYNIENWELRDGLVDVYGDVDLYGSGLTKLPLNFGYVGRNFWAEIGAALEKIVSSRGWIKKATGEERESFREGMKELIAALTKWTTLRGQELWNEILDRLKGSEVVVVDDILQEFKDQVLPHMSIICLKRFATREGTPKFFSLCYRQLNLIKMYKCFKLTKKYRLTFNKFPKTAKNIKSVDAYSTGIRNWTADDSYNYSIVLGTFRIIFSIERTDVGCCQG